MAGSVVLIVAGLLSTVVGNATDAESLSADNYQTISESYTGDASTTGSYDVSRDFDRTFSAQSKTQASQVETAQKELATNVNASSAEAAKKAKQWVLPVTGYRLTAQFGQSSGLWASTHTGLDFAGPSGSTLVAMAKGTITETGYEGAYGNRTILTLEDGTEIWYCHQSRISVETGQQVAPGDVIGYTGSTGNVTGPHLHLEIRPGGGDPVDPVPVMSEHSVTP